MAIAAPTTQSRTSATPPDAAAMSHLLVSTFFLVLGAVLYTSTLLATMFPHVFQGPLSAGRLKPAAMTVIVVGWLVPALAGAVYHVLPRLAGTPLWQEARIGGAAWAHGALALLGAAAVLLGFGNGVQPLGLPWWLDLPVLGLFSLPAIVTIQTVRKRTQADTPVALWFVMAGSVWLPLLYLVANIPGLNAVARSLQEVTFSAGFSNLWVVAIGTGVAYFTVSTLTDEPFANRQMARVGFWSLAVAAAWAGPAQLSFGPTPAWLAEIASVLTLALPVAALANAMAISLAALDSLAEPPVFLRATLWALAIVVFGSAITSAASFGSASALVGFTAFWDGLEFMTLFGAGSLFVAGWAYRAIPEMTALVSEEKCRRHINFTVSGALVTGALLMVAGVLQGFQWAGGSFAGAFVDAGADWSWAGRGLMFVAVITALVTLAGLAMFGLNILAAVTSGDAGLRAILMPQGADHE